MKKKKMIPALLISALLLTSVTFADNSTAPGQTASEPGKAAKTMIIMTKDKAKDFTDSQKTTLLDEFGKMIAKQVDSGVITKDDGAMLTEQFKMSIGDGNVVFPAKVGVGGMLTQKFEDFDKLTLEEKKQKMVEDMTAMTKKEVAAGTITQQEADKRIDDLKKQLEKWDGKTPIAFGIKAGMALNTVNVESIGLDEYKDLTVAQKIDKVVDAIKSRLGKWDGSSPVIFEIGMPDKPAMTSIMGLGGKTDMMFAAKENDENLTLEQKKENILNKLTASYNEMVKQGEITQEEANTQINEVKEKLKNWDGKQPLTFEIKASDKEKNFIIKLQ